MDLLLDTHVIAWLASGERRIPQAVIERLRDEQTALFVSAATAWEYAELALRGRLPEIARYEAIVEEFGLEELAVPVGLWRLASALPDLHRDPVDRMLIAHAIHADMMLVTADKVMRDYPVRSLW